MTQYVWFVRGEAHVKLAATSIASVRRADSSAKCLIVTDDPRLKLPVGVRCEVLRFDSDPDAPIMLANLDAQVQAFERCDHFERMVFLDTDIIMLEPLPHKLGADLIVTWRSSVGLDDDGKPVEGIAKTMPYNYGVIGAYNCVRVLEAFIWMRERVRVMAPRLQQWYGNQVALAALCGPPPEDPNDAGPHSRAIPWLPTAAGSVIGVKKLQCEHWNYTPQAEGEDLVGRRVLHFKGPKRALMRGYAEKLRLDWHE